MKNLKKILPLIIIAILIIAKDHIAHFVGRYGAGFSIIFWSILLEAMPFVLLGCLISSLIGRFVSAEFLARLIPKNKIAGIFFAALLGITFPLCECVIVPITRRLVKKGLPMPLAIAFMLSVPILNPVVLLSTHYAFKGHGFVVFLRAFLGYFAAVLISLILGSIFGFDYNPDIEEKKVLKILNKTAIKTGRALKNKTDKKTFLKELSQILSHTFQEFIEVLKYLILGALLSALLQSAVPRIFILKIGSTKFLSIPVLMLLAFILSLCSEADAFIARTFVGQFSFGGIIAFLIFGPMLDIKNILMLSGSFKKKFVIKLSITIAAVCLLFGIIVNMVM